MDNEITSRYAVIDDKNKREIVLIRGNGCKWRRCRFCDYHLDSSKNEAENFALNELELNKITGVHGKVEIINSGSFVDLDEKTMNLIEQICIDTKMKEIHFECHYMHRESIADIRKRFANIGMDVKVKIGVETFDHLFRECYLLKGIDTDNPQDIADYFDECCLLQGIPGQSVQSMTNDIDIGLKYFQRVCINIMQENGRPVRPDPKVIEQFVKEVYPIYQHNERVDILLDNNAFGVGGVTTNVK